MVLPTFIQQALRGDPITVYGTGEQSRCFGYVSDVVEALAQIAQTMRAVGEVINVGNDEEITINDLARKVKVAAQSDSVIVHVPYEQAYGPGFEDMYRRVPSLTKLERLIGFRPQTNVDQIIRSVIDHCVESDQQHGARDRLYVNAEVS